MASMKLYYLEQVQIAGKAGFFLFDWRQVWMPTSVIPGYCAHGHDTSGGPIFQTSQSYTADFLSSCPVLPLRPNIFSIRPITVAHVWSSCANMTSSMNPELVHA